MSIDDGLVKLVYMVDPQGKPYQVMVARTSMPKFSKEAVKSINRNQFKPAMRNANPIDSRHYRDLKFVFDEADSHDSLGNKGSVGDARRFSFPDGYKSYYEQFTQALDQAKPDQSKLQQLLNTSRILSIRASTVWLTKAWRVIALRKNSTINLARGKVWRI
jgi:hypothetical protein